MASGRGRPGRLKDDADILCALSEAEESDSDLSGLDDSFQDPEFRPDAEEEEAGEEAEEEEETIAVFEKETTEAVQEIQNSSRKRRLSNADEDELMENSLEIEIAGSGEKEEENLQIAKEIDQDGSSLRKKSSSSSGVIKWEGQRLWPPPESGKRKKPSIAWKHGGFLKDKTGQLLRSQVICSYCGAKMVYHGSPSNFVSHLFKVHSNEVGVKTDEAEDPPVNKITNMFSVLGAKNDIKYPDSHPKQREHRKLTVDWVIKSLRSFKTVEDEGFIKIIQNADPKLKTISRRTLVRDIENRNEIEREKLRERFGDIDYFTCTNDGGSSKDTRSFIVITLHWVSKLKGTLQLNKKILSMLELTKDKKAKTYRSEVDKTLDEYQVKKKVF